jgi:hypothetical protein
MNDVYRGIWRRVLVQVSAQVWVQAEEGIWDLLGQPVRWRVCRQLRDQAWYRARTLIIDAVKNRSNTR